MSRKFSDEPSKMMFLQRGFQKVVWEIKGTCSINRIRVKMIEVERKGEVDTTSVGMRFAFF
jgi:hypothetical protein